jgi:cyclopropane-fatty-acyl-phospholipid synthase
MDNIQGVLDWVERGWAPDFAVRQGIRALVRSRVRELKPNDPAAAGELIERFVAQMDEAPVALVPALANTQHYEVPADFFGLVLGPHRKYSCCLFDREDTTLATAEAEALRVTCERAELADGQQVLELGCGWGSLSLWMAAHYPRSQITAVSNSHSQRAYIERCAAERGLANLRVVTCDMNEFDAGRQYDRIVSVEMFEHMRNWRALFARVAGWLAPGGRFFMHVFAHRAVPYAYEVRDESDWMSRHFFSGGMMPSDDLPLRFQDDLRAIRRWRWDGTHYEKTSNAWLVKLDARRDEALAVLAGVHGADAAGQWLQRWRIFFMACAELFAFDHGQEWWVSHTLFERRVD